MEKISILMNCYNGEKYLKEAIDSVFSQTFIDWKIIFIDNCSTDNSAHIAKSYDNEKLVYYKTEVNVPLGAARNFGIDKCSGQYLAFLDTDDIYKKNTLEILLNEIEKSNFVLVYGGHKNINGEGKNIGVFLPAQKEGDIFKNLLVQFDIPTASSIINLEELRKSGLNYDSNIYTSAEYCLFLQLSILNKMKAIDKPIVNYRIHDGALTNKTISKWALERRYTLDKIKKENEHIENKYTVEFEKAYARAAYYEAQYLVSIDKKRKAFKVLSKYAFINKQYFLLSVILLLPSFVWNKIQKLKYGRNI